MSGRSKESVWKRIKQKPDPYGSTVEIPLQCTVHSPTWTCVQCKFSGSEEHMSVNYHIFSILFVSHSDIRIQLV